MGPVFRSRSKDEQAATATVAASSQQPRDPQAPKGRPTPKRSDSQARRRTLATKPGDRKEAARRAREARRADLARQREALAKGDERYLPARDKGPVRRFARDFVDSRFCVAEFFLPMAVVLLVLSMLPSMQATVTLVWMGMIVMIVTDSIGLGIRLRKQLSVRFPEESRRGVVFYAVMRSLQMRRLRLPKPQVKRGERP
ncbi:DUF3043 domain-containing protein [Streptomyces zingiberis]|uniref:DUF3043 domain-containing protein n=1 Tax=Streptomyces zingiberis TaxID=2053010 RepID=UPI0019D01901